MPDSRSRSWFLVWNNPDRIITYKHAENGDTIKDENGKNVVLSDIPNPDYAEMTEQEICIKVLNMWTTSGKGRTGAVVFAKSANGLRHLHIVAESNNPIRFSSIKKVFPKAHAEATQGTKQDVEDYIAKVGKFEEKGELILAREQAGDIRGAQGRRTDLIDCLDLHRLIFEEDKTPRDILKEYPIAYKSYNLMMKMYNDKLDMTVPVKRNVNVTWLVGETETGKSHEYIELCKKYGRDSVYRVANYEHPFDNYIDEKVLVLDEFRDSCFSFSDLLNIIEGYYERVNARYFNHIPQWTEVYITSPLLPYDCYNKALRNFNDKSQQFYRRIDLIVHCSAVVFDNAEGKKTKYCFKREYKPDINGKADDYRKAFECEKIHYLSELQKGNYNPYGLVYSEPIIDEHRYDDVIDIYDEGGSEFGTYSTAV